MVMGVTYSDERMTISAEKCIFSMLKNGVEQATPYSINNISPDFVNDNWFTFFEYGDGYVRGAGYWIWKPRVIFEAMLKLKDGDILVYSDAGVEWIDSAQHIIDVMDASGEDIFLFTSGHLHHEYCKRDVTMAINGEKTNYLEQVHAAVIFFRVNDYTRRFVKEWLLWCQMPGLIDDSPSKLPNHPDFKDHRHDQAILTCMAIREGLTLHYWPDELWFSTQRHRWPEDKYPLLFRHHRKRNNEWQS